MGANNSKPNNNSNKSNNLDTQNNSLDKNLVNYSEKEPEVVFELITNLSNQIMDSFTENFLSEDFCNKISLIYQKKMEKLNIKVLREIKEKIDNEENTLNLKLLLQHTPKNNTDKYFVDFFHERLNEYFWKKGVKYQKSILESEHVKLGNLNNTIESDLSYIDINHVKQLLKKTNNLSGGANTNQYNNELTKKLGQLSENNNENNENNVENIENLIEEVINETNNQLEIENNQNRNPVNNLNSDGQGSNLSTLKKQNNKAQGNKNKVQNNSNSSKETERKENNQTNKQKPNNNVPENKNQAQNNKNKLKETGRKENNQGNKQNQNKFNEKSKGNELIKQNQQPKRNQSFKQNQQPKRNQSSKQEFLQNQDKNKKFKQKYYVPRSYDEPEDLCEKSNSKNQSSGIKQKCLMTKKSLCRSIAQNFIVRNNIIAAILTTIPRISKNKNGQKIYEGGICFQKFLNLEKCSVCVPTNFSQLKKETDLGKVILEILKKSKFIDKKSCNKENDAIFLQLDKDQKEILLKHADEYDSELKDAKNDEQKVIHPNWKSNKLYLEFMSKLKNKYFESLNFLISILEELKNQPFVSNSTLNTVALKTKNVIDNMYNYVNYYYIYATLLLIKSDYNTMNTSNVNQIPKIENALIV